MYTGGHTTFQPASEALGSADQPPVVVVFIGIHLDQVPMTD